MAINVTESDDKQEITIHISGRFDFSCHHAFLQEYKNYPKGEKRFVLDLSATEYMDSSAMGMLLQLREHAVKQAGGVTLTNANESVSTILKIANFDKLFSIV